MSYTNTPTPADIARTLKRSGWTQDKAGNWKSGTGNVFCWTTAIYLHKLGETTPFVVVPDNRELRKDKIRKPGLGNPAKEPTFKPPVAGQLSPEKIREALRIAKQGLSLTQTAKKAGIARSTLSRLLQKQNELA